MTNMFVIFYGIFTTIADKIVDVVCNIKNSNIMLVHFLKRYFKTKLNDNLNVYKSIVTPLNKIDKKTICRLKNIIPQLYIANN